MHSERKLACNHNDLTKCRTPQGGSHYNGTPKYCTGMPNHNLLFPLKLSDRVVMLESLQVYSSVEEAHHNGLYKTSNWIFVRKSLQWHFRAVQMERMLAYNHAQWSQETLPTSLGECSACVISVSKQKIKFYVTEKCAYCLDFTSRYGFPKLNTIVFNH